MTNSERLITTSGLKGASWWTVRRGFVLSTVLLLSCSSLAVAVFGEISSSLRLLFAFTAVGLSAWPIFILFVGLMRYLERVAAERRSAKALQQAAVDPVNATVTILRHKAANLR